MARPTAFDGQNKLFTAPQGRENDTLNLPAFVDEDRQTIYSCWTLSEQEMETVKKDGVIWLAVRSNQMPEVYVTSEHLITVRGEKPKVEKLLPLNPHFENRFGESQDRGSHD